jgi:proton-translocating NADH-quinone oxidoreductase chain L
MYLLAVFFPFLGFLFAAGLGRFLGHRGAALVATTCLFLSCFLSWIAFYEVGLCGCSCFIYLSPWFSCEFFDASWGFQFDSLTVVMLIVVTTISSLVHLYSISYMESDPHLPRFMAYLSIFTFFMLVLVTADNYLQLFFGWEGIGLASYLLINFWITRLPANKAAIKAMLLNKIGDFGLALGIITIFLAFRTVDFGTVFACTPYLSNQSFIFCNVEVDILTTISGLLFVGVLGKSAQIGLHTWLPCAMEGPTPVSALIHAATLVTAGVVLLARSSPLIEYAPKALVLITVVGAMTSFLAASTGVVQNDLKRVIAYSTCSQLGYMVFACGMSSYAVSVFHLMNHAFFKALLFLGAGSIIHALSDEQDLRKLGGLGGLLPYTYTMLIIGSLALTGFPFATGFYSKDVILELAAANYTVTGNFAYWLGTFSVFFTSYYSFRLVFLGLIGPANFPKRSAGPIHDAPAILGLPLIPLAFGSIFAGYLFRDLMIGTGTHFWGAALFTLPDHSLLVESEFVPQELKYLPLFLTFSGGVVAYGINLAGSQWTYQWKKTTLGRSLYTFLNKRWFFDKVYNDFVARSFLSFGYSYSFKLLDKGVLEILGPFGIVATLRKVIPGFTGIQTGFLYHYALAMLFGLLLLMSFLLEAPSMPLLSYWTEPRFYGLFFLSLFFTALGGADVF